jgi:hydrogenase maturation protein HypF
LGEERPARPPALEASVDRGRWEQVTELVASGVASPPTTSMGRLFDAVAAICGVRASVNYEGQAAAELEATADLGEQGAYPLPMIEAGPDGRPLLLDARELVRAVAADAAADVRIGEMSARFHNGVAAGTAAALRAEAERRGIGTIVLSGGVFQNRLLLERTRRRLAESDLRVLVPRRLPPNDGGISYGQAAVAAATLAER